MARRARQDDGRNPEAFVALFADALSEDALPGEIAGLDHAALTQIASLLAETAAKREPHAPSITIQPYAGGEGDRRLRIAIVNDDMPFLVDSVAGVIAAHSLTIERLLHPLIEAARDADGRLVAVQPLGGGAGDFRRESVIFIETERADARTRAALAREIAEALADVRVAVADWKKMVARLQADADRMEDGETAELLRWLARHNFTLLGAAAIDLDGGQALPPLGILARDDATPIWAPGVEAAVHETLARSKLPLLIAKTDRMSTVHRRAMLDYVGVPTREWDGRLSGISWYVGLFTSQALSAAPGDVPMVRDSVRKLTQELGFAPTSHAGKALTHAIGTLPRDLLFTLDEDLLRDVTLTAMSLIDRPRAKLRIVRDRFARHSTALVWLPRDEYSGERRIQIGTMVAQALSGRIENWSAELGGEGLVALRYIVAHDAGTTTDGETLDRRLQDMVRGWVPAIEAGLRAAKLSPARAARLALTYGGAFTASYRSHFQPADAVEDIQRLSRLRGADDRDVRISPGEAPGGLRLNIYRLGEVIPLSDAVPVLEHFGFRVIEEFPYDLDDGRLGWIHEFSVEPTGGAFDPARDGARVEQALQCVLTNQAENDGFNALMVRAGLDNEGIVLFRALFRYLRQTGAPYGVATVVEALANAPDVAHGLIALFTALHHPGKHHDKQAADEARRGIEAGLIKVTAIDDDRILRLLIALIDACLRTNAFVEGGPEALAFKFDSARVPGLPRPVPWREIFVYCPRVEGIHLRGGPVARGGLRWSDRRDDFRTEILGLMKAQIVKNAVIVPTGAKGGFYPKQLPPPGDREAWLAEGTEAYRIFIRALLSLTDNIVDDAVVPPAEVRRLDADDPYLVVAADKGTAAFSDIANGIAVDRGFWLGDAFASGGSQGYDHKAMGITARGAWISVQRHFAEMDVDVQADAISVAGCGDMSGDVFGNGMLLSKTLRLVAAFDHRHIFIDPEPDAAKSWAERKRLFELPRSSWDDYDKALISNGGGVFPRTQKSIPLTPEIRAVLGVEGAALGPSELIAAILRAPVDLLWFGGIGTYIKGAEQSDADVGDRANDANRVNGRDVRARVVGEGANLGVTQAGRIEYAAHGGRINTDFIDNSAGVDCSDNEVNIKIALGPEVRAGRLAIEDRNRLLVEMTDAVSQLVLTDNRLQTQALSIAERGGARAMSRYVRVIQTFEASGRVDRAVEGLPGDEELGQRAQYGRGLERPELAVLLSHAKLALQDAIEASAMLDDPLLEPILVNAFPQAMVKRFGGAIAAHRLRGPIIATELANDIVNRLGIPLAFAVAEEQGTSVAHIAGAYVVVSSLFALPEVWAAIEAEAVPETVRLELLESMAGAVQFHLADLVRITSPDIAPGKIADTLRPGIDLLRGALDKVLRTEARDYRDRLRSGLADRGVSAGLAERLSTLHIMDGAIGIAMLATDTGTPADRLALAYTRLGEELGLDWAKGAAVTLDPVDPWERLLVAGVVRDLEQLRLDLLARIVTPSADPDRVAAEWLERHAPRVRELRDLVARARAAGTTTPTIVAQLASQARTVLAH
jgi:glutamate dehydrogenase